MNVDLPNLLRALARGSDAKKSRHDIIFNAAADEIEWLRSERERQAFIIGEFCRGDDLKAVLTSAQSE